MDRLNALGFSFQDITQVISAVWNGFCSLLAPVFEGAFQAIAVVLSTVLNVITGILDVFIGLFTGDWSQMWTGIQTIFSGVWEGIKGVLSAAVSIIQGIVDVFLGCFGTSWSEVWTNIKTFFEGIWNGIKTAIITPIEAAKNTIKGIVDKITEFFSSMKISLPHIKLSHFKISGSLSIAPPSVPHLSIDWYKEGGIMTRSTLFGMNGTNLMAGGEAGAEAILPLKGFYSQLESILSNRMDTSTMERYLSIIAANGYLPKNSQFRHLGVF